MAVGPLRQQHGGAGGDEQRGDDVAEARQSQQHRGEQAVATCLQAPRDHAEEHQPDRQSDRERELAREGGRNIAAPDGEPRRAIEQERDRGDSQERGTGEWHAGEAAEHVGGHR